MKNEKGITLTILTITILIMIIIAGTVIKASTNSLVIRKVNSLFTDIESISSKISIYYLENNELPVLDTKYAGSVEEFKALIESNGAKENIINPNDGEDYYVIDLSRIENLTLNYGRDYQKWKEQENPLSSQYQDLFVINAVTQQIYYPKGIQYKNSHYFTTMIDIAKVDRIVGYLVDAEFRITNISSTFKKNKQENVKVIVTSNIDLLINTEKYVTNTLSYAFATEKKTQEEINNLAYSKFSLNSENEASLASIGLDRLTQKYYLYIRALDIYGKYSYLEQEIDRLENAEAGWVLADDLNQSNDWYQYQDTGASNEIATVNAPILADGMEAVKYVGEENTSESEQATLTSGSRWANAVTKDGSMWVWIPRYAYKITSGYHKSGANINPSSPENGAGTIEIAFVEYDEEQKKNVFLDSNNTGEIKTSDISNTDYNESNPSWILAPGFELGEEHLSGFWMAKFKASNTELLGDASSTANNSTLILQVRPNVKSWRSIQLSNMFIVCKNLNKSSDNIYFDTLTNVDTHMTKNVEWGACAYLAHSKYGLNGQEICINSNNKYITGIGNGNSTGSQNSSSAYNTANGVTASTTRNVYGIYDMSGGGYEYVAACLQGYEKNIDENADIKYIDIYNSQYNNSKKYGDAIYETSNGSSNQNSWFYDRSYYMVEIGPCLRRGGDYSDAKNTGLFSFYSSAGKAAKYGGFRPVIAITK